MQRHTTRKPHLLSVMVILMALICLFSAACTTEIEDETQSTDATAAETTPETQPESVPATSDTSTETETEVPTETLGETTGETSSETVTEEETEPTTEDPATRINVPTDATHVTFYEPDEFALSKILTDRNQCRYSITADETYGSVLKLSTTSGANDPYVTLKYETYMELSGLSTISADDYKCIVMTIRQEKCTCESFQLFYCAGDVTGASGDCTATSAFNATEDGWQFIVFDLSDAKWAGDIHSFRLDFLTAPQGRNETVYVYAMDFYKDAKTAYEAIGIDRTAPGEGSDLTEARVDGVEYDKQTAPDEDASVDMWFDHMTEKLGQTNTTSSGRYTYVLHMAGNSIEDCQFFLAPDTTRTFSVSLSEFSDGNGHTLTAKLLSEHYAEVMGEMLPDALPTLESSITVEGGHSQGFVIKVWADTDQAAGLYSATLNITDTETGKIIKTAKVYTKVYGFFLSDETALRSAVGLNYNTIYKSYKAFGMTEQSKDEIYKTYYDFLLENRLCAYRLPYNLVDEEVAEYLDNPRVNSFVVNQISGNMAEAYNILKNNPSWLKKSFYYEVDEPSSIELLNQLASYSQQLEASFPGYNQVSPFFTDITVGDTDQIEFMKPYVNIWCTKLFALTPRDKMAVAGTQYISSTLQEAQYGTFAERMAALKAEGDELWLYVCWEPEQPYVNWLVRGDGTEPIVSIWQCKQTGATGILYWASVHWHDESDPMNDLTPYIAGSNSYGDGILLYSGAQVGSYEPVSSIRLETVRMGIQDYQLLTMLEDLLGEEAAAEMVSMVTEDVVTYTSDDDYLKAVRVLLLEKVAEAMK